MYMRMSSGQWTGSTLPTNTEKRTEKMHRQC